MIIVEQVLFVLFISSIIMGWFIVCHLEELEGEIIDNSISDDDAKIEIDNDVNIQMWENRLQKLGFCVLGSGSLFILVYGFRLIYMIIVSL